MPAFRRKRTISDRHANGRPLSWAEEYNMSKIPQGEWNAICGTLSKRQVDQQNCAGLWLHAARNSLYSQTQPPAAGGNSAPSDRSTTGGGGPTRVVRANAADPVAASAFYPEKFTNGAKGPALVRAGAIGSAQSVQSTPSPLDGMPPTPALPLSPNLPDRKPAPPAGPQFGASGAGQRASPARRDRDRDISIELRRGALGRVTGGV